MDDFGTLEWIGERLRRVDLTSKIGSQAHESYLFPEYKDDFDGFVVDVLGDVTWKGVPTLWRGQRAVAEAIPCYKVVSVYSSRGTGKDHVIARIMLWLFYTRPCRILCLAPSMRQLQEVLFAQVSKAFYGSRQKLLGELLTMKLKMPGDASHYILGIPAADPDRVRGFHAGVEVPGDPDQDDLLPIDYEMIERMLLEGGEEPDEVYVIVDEPEGVPDEVFRVLDGTLSKKRAKMALIGNPAQSLFDDHRYPNLLRGKDETVFRINLSSFNHSRFAGENDAQLAMFDAIYDEAPSWLISQEKREAALLEYPSQDATFLSDWRGLFSEDAMANQVIPYTALRASCERYADNRARISLGPRIGVDLGFGGDPSVASLVVNGVLCSSYDWRTPADDPRMQVNLARRIRELSIHWGQEVAKEFPASWDGGAIVGGRLSIDDTGLPGVCDILSELKVDCDRVNFGAGFRGDPTGLVSSSYEMANQRAGMYWHTRMGLQDGRYHIPDEHRFRRYYEELPWTLYERNFREIKLERKKETIKRHKHSPDYADSFVLATIPTVDREVIWSTGGPILSRSLPTIGDKGGGKGRLRRDKRQWRRFELPKM